MNRTTIDRALAAQFDVDLARRSPERRCGLRDESGERRDDSLTTDPRRIVVA
ncbi:MAG: hypothetical protein HIU84_12670 [Acidobacteria bacterium]|nr:hypothetical protein [Acidobacteriota bacterium]